MKRLVTLHCGHRIMSANPAQRFCNRKCSGYFVSRRPKTNKRNKQATDATSKRATHLYRYIPDNDPVWRERAKRLVTKKGYVDLYFWSTELQMQFRRREHRIMWAIANGESVPRGWVIHHRDEDRGNNDPTNLLALTKSMHQELHRRLEYLAKQFHGLEYVVQRHKLNAEYAQSAKELLERRRDWFDE